MHGDTDPKNARPGNASRTSARIDSYPHRKRGTTLGRLVIGGGVAALVALGAAWELGGLPHTPGGLTAPPKLADTVVRAIGGQGMSAHLEGLRAHVIGTSAAHTTAARAYSLAGNLDKAERAAARAAASGGFSADDRLALDADAALAMLARGNWPQAASRLDALLDQGARSDVTAHFAEASVAHPALLSARAHLRTGDVAQAEARLATFSEVSERSVNGALAFFLAANIAVAKGESLGAEAAYSRTLSQLPEDAKDTESAAMRCVSLMRLGGFDSSLAACREGIDRFSRDAEVWRAYGVALEVYGDHDAARRALGRAQDLRSGDEEIARRLDALPRR